ncbi:DegT/DnrJ/EryC1/StrS family aminotransferase [bacterium]|nr:DegT/DnrJ/EryC1/StrS family aminotransferase [bacterium]
MTWKVPLTTPTIGEEEKRALMRVLDGGWLPMGPEVEAFEREFAETLGVPHAIATSNGTDGLAMCYDALGVAPGNQVAMSGLTFVASMNVALRRGQIPLLIDITSEDDLTLSVKDLQEKMSPDVHLIVTMPYGGFPCDIQPILELGRRYRVPVLEDAGHGILANYNDRFLGTNGAAGVFSFFASENLTTGEGGMIVTSDRAIAERLRLIRNHGMTRSSYDFFHHGPSDYDIIVAGHNFRMDDMRGAIGREQLRRLHDTTRRRRETAELIKTGILDRTTDIRFPSSGARGKGASYHLLVALLPKEVDRNMFMRRMADRGIQTSVHYKPLHRFTHVQGIWPREPHLPILESVEKRLVTLPLSPSMTEKQIELVIDSTVESLA